jgi:hypothetical protein
LRRRQEGRRRTQAHASAWAFFAQKETHRSGFKGSGPERHLPKEQISGQAKLYTPLKIGSRQDQQNINTKTTGNHAAAGFLRMLTIDQYFINNTSISIAYNFL